MGCIARLRGDRGDDEGRRGSERDAGIGGDLWKWDIRLYGGLDGRAKGDEVWFVMRDGLLGFRRSRYVREMFGSISSVPH